MKYELPDSLGYAISYLYLARRRFLAVRLAKYGLSDPLHLLVTGIGKNPGKNQDFFAEYFVLDKTTVARGAARLEQMGYITRETCEDDKRQYKLFLTEDGNNINRLVSSVYREWKELLSSGLTAEETEVAFDLLLRMAEVITPQTESE